jgi:hypothetical protein
MELISSKDMCLLFVHIADGEVELGKVETADLLLAYKFDKLKVQPAHVPNPKVLGVAKTFRKFVMEDDGFVTWELKEANGKHKFIVSTSS